MKKNILIVGSIIILIILAIILFYTLKNPIAFNKSDTNYDKGTIISIKDFEFNPIEINITAGESITWKNEDSVKHDVTIDNGLFDIDIEPGETFKFTFNETGTYNYHCDIHPSMNGIINVK
ncbi:MAG: cupredoxin domain-containing protein [Candidatus Pacearchaeota archaeon]|jgi:plastocyanin